MFVFFIPLQVKQVLDEIRERLPDDFNVQEMMARCEDRNPYVVVAFQECERMSMLTSEMRRSLRELDLGLKVKHHHVFYAFLFSLFLSCHFSFYLRVNSP